VARPIDRGSHFLVLSPRAGLGMHDDDGKKSVQRGGSIVGIGVVAGRRVLVDPCDTRHVLGLCLAIAREAESRTLRLNTFGVARL
jgi:acetyl-CoA carboxylase carboxyltransferase component